MRITRRCVMALCACMPALPPHPASAASMAAPTVSPRVSPAAAPKATPKAAPKVTPSVLAVVELNLAGASLGNKLAAAGDVNGDGYQDIVATSNGASNGDGTCIASVHVFTGSADGLQQTPAWTVTFTDTSETNGLPVAGVGDTNKDGYDDLLIGHPAATNTSGATTAGKIMLFLGAATLPAQTPDFVVESSVKGNKLGFSVAAAGDVNGDGYADFAAGAPFAESGSSEANEGRVTVWYGGTTGVSSDPAWNAESNFLGAQLGCTIATAGDVNADGYDDLAATACFYDGPETDEGQIRLYLGGATGLELTPAWTAEGNGNSLIAGTSLSGAGDVNGDGYSDLLVGIPFSDEQFSNAGLVRIYLGNATGLMETPAWNFAQPQDQGNFAQALFAPGDLTGDGLDDALMGTGLYDIGGLKDAGLVVLMPGSAAAPPTEPVWRLEGDRASSYLGTALTYAGDLTGDGCGELVVGAPGYSNPETSEGRLLIYTVDANDRDGDAFCAGSAVYSDCNDTLASAYPGADEVPGNGIDESCDGQELCFVDADQDGYADVNAAPVPSLDLTCSSPGMLPASTGPADCDDTRSDVSPAAPEVCDTADNDCDKSIDEGVTTHYLIDQDDDGYGAPDQGVEDCSLPIGYVEDPQDPALTDCNDAQSNIHPGAEELPDDGIEQNCDGQELCYVDADNDGYRPDPVSTLLSADLDCTDPGEAQGVDPAGDCDDASATFNPGVLEVCDAQDNDCNLVIDNNTAVDCASGDFDGDGFTELAGDCEDQQADIFPSAEEVCDDRDNNCDAATDEGGVCDTPTPEGDGGGCGCTSTQDLPVSPLPLAGILLLGLRWRRPRR